MLYVNLNRILPGNDMRAGPCILSLLLLATGFTGSGPARAEAFHTCAGFIDSVPATVSTQGVWCLRRDLSTAIAVGSAIRIQANNVTIDCNGFKLGGLAAGAASQANGVYAQDAQNVTIRNCNIRGFGRGVYLDRGAGHLVEDNRFDNNLSVAISICCDYYTVVRRNLVYDTGASTQFTTAIAINANGNITDNTIRGVHARASGVARGISASSPGGIVRGNAISQVVSDAEGSAVAVGILADSSGQTIADNSISHLASGNGSGVGIHATGAQAQIAGNRLHTVYGGTYGIRATGAASVCVGNSAIGFATAFSSCEASEGNVSPP